MGQLKFKYNHLLLLVGITTLFSNSEGLESILSRCCNMGVRWAWEDKTCSEFPAPVQSVNAEHQAPCLSTIDACCRRNYRERQCIKGQESAKAGEECRPGEGPAGQYHQDCCEGCKLGLIAGAMRLACEFQSLKIALGPPWDTSLTRCCLQAGGSNSLGGVGRPIPNQTPRSQSPAPAPLPFPSTGGSSQSTYRPTQRTTLSSSLQDFCALFPGQLCSHICVTEGNSYSCQCREGYRLLPDGKSCQQDPNATSTFTQSPSSSQTQSGFGSGSGSSSKPDFINQHSSSANRHPHPHQQQATPTITPNPNPNPTECPLGFVYNVNSQVCDDIDECLLSEGARACFPYKKCRNTVGSFLCEENREEGDRNQQCPPGYRFKEDAATCVDIDECAEGFDICVREIQYCINTPGGFDCQSKKEFNRYNCPAGYKFNNNTLNCEDVNECLERLDSCDRNSELCRNTAGAYECDTQCLTGFRYNIRVRTCQDIDECTEGTHDCRIDKESCVNVQGSYQCHQLQSTDSNDCPPGYEPNKNYTFLCRDRDECTLGLHTCAAFETCINEAGGYRCEANSEDGDGQGPGQGQGQGQGQGYDLATSSEDSEDETTETTSPDNSILDNNFFERRATDNARREPGNLATVPPRAVDPIRHNTIVKEPSLQHATRPTVSPEPISGTGSGSGSGSGSTDSGCATGYRIRRPSRPGVPALCDDIDECHESNPCDSTQVCQNTQGSFYCHCRPGYYRDPITRACLDINECQTGQHNCASSQRCDNSPGTFTCIRITGCGTGYTLNSGTGECEDDDECLFGNHDCGRLGPEWACKNTLGSFRCEKVSRQCPTGLSLAANGECRPTCSSGFTFNPRGECVDIDECRVTQGGRSVCPSSQQCVNTEGSYQCLSKVICPNGFEPEVSGNGTTVTKCVDIDECARGTHTCQGNQICVNRGGGFLCQCPAGYTVTPSGHCEDIDECTRYGGQVCASNADCHNTQGSFRCICKEGFEQGLADNRTCIDIDECVTITGLCEQNCINTWGSYKCSCGAGYTISPDSRTCRDVDECAQVKDGFLCVGNCVNTHGSYRCDCPEGYRLGADSRTCQDIDECERPNACRSDETCLNTRGGYRCNRIQCPPGYEKDGDQNDRCKKSRQCTERDIQCLKLPLTISRNFLSFTSNIRIPSAGYVDMFTMRGPTWPGAVMHFNLQVKNSRAGGNVAVVSRQHFLLRRPTPYQAVVALAKPIAGPQDVELELTMEVYHRGAYAGSAVAQILIVVTTYEF